MSDSGGSFHITAHGKLDQELQFLPERAPALAHQRTFGRWQGGGNKRSPTPSIHADERRVMWDFHLSSHTALSTGGVLLGEECAPGGHLPEHGEAREADDAREGEDARDGACGCLYGTRQQRAHE
jgi:hypothetical protein